MRRTALILGAAVVTAAILIPQALFKGQTVHAKSWGFTNADFAGSYISQWSGTNSFPAPPLSALNGPYALVGKTVSDGNGHVTGTTTESYNGVVIRGRFEGTYNVSPDGSIVITITSSLEPIGKVTFEAEGHLYDDGGQARLILTRLVDAPLPPGYVGAVLTAHMVRQ